MAEPAQFLQPIEYPEWDISFCHRFGDRFPLLDTLAREFRMDLEFDRVLAMQDTRQTWCQSSLFQNLPAERPWTARRMPSPSATS